MSRRAAAASLLCLAACAAPPEVEVSRFEGRAPPAPEGYPALLPIPDLEPERAGPAPAEGASEEARAAALRSRATALAGPVIAPAERARLDEARR